jgi:uncharacterized protein (DUF2249 family)
MASRSRTSCARVYTTFFVKTKGRRQRLWATTNLTFGSCRKPDKHPTIFPTYAALPVGESFVLANNHVPKQLRAELDADHPGSYASTPLHQRRQALVLQPRKNGETLVQQAVW